MMPGIEETLTECFNQGHVLPRVLRADSGPQFRLAFDNFLEKLDILRETSSAYNASLNGMAERAVVSMKRVIKKGVKGSLLKMTADLNNLVRSDNSATPTEMIAGRSVLTEIPGSGRIEVDLAKIRQKRILTQEALMKK